MVSWEIHVEDNSIQVEPNATVTLHSSPESPQNLTIGRHDIDVTATDNAGNIATCKFRVIVRGKLELSLLFGKILLVYLYTSSNLIGREIMQYQVSWLEVT